MTLTGEVLVKLAAAPEERLTAVLAILDGARVPKDPLAGTLTLAEIMDRWNLSRATVYRKFTRAGIREVGTFGGVKKYAEKDVERALGTDVLRKAG